MASTLSTGVPSANLNLINGLFEKIFSKAFITTEPQAKFVQQRTTPGKQVNLAALLQQPSVRIWKDQKRFNSLNFNFNGVPMAPLEASIEIDRFDMLGDVVGLYGDAVASLAGQTKKFTDFAWTAAVQSGYATEYTNLVQGGDLDYGTSNQTVTGDALFMSGSGGTGGHAWSGTNVATQNNIVYGQLSDPLTWGNATNLMRGFVGDRGQPLDVEPLGVVYGPSDEYAINNALDAKWAAVDARPTITTTNAMPKVALDNVMARYGLSLNRLNTLYKNPGVAYLIGATAGIQSSYQYMLEPLHLVPRTDPTSQNVFTQRMFQWSVEGYGRVIIPLWFNIIRVVDPSAQWQ